ELRPPRERRRRKNQAVCLPVLTCQDALRDKRAHAVAEQDRPDARPRRHAEPLYGNRLGDHLVPAVVVGKMAECCYVAVGAMPPVIVPDNREALLSAGGGEAVVSADVLAKAVQDLHHSPRLPRFPGSPAAHPDPVPVHRGQRRPRLTAGNPVRSSHRPTKIRQCLYSSVIDRRGMLALNKPGVEFDLAGSYESISYKSIHP